MSRKTTVTLCFVIIKRMASTNETENLGESDTMKKLKHVESKLLRCNVPVDELLELLDVEERLVSVDELLDADEVFCTGTAVVVSPVGSVTYLGNRVSYGEGIGAVSQQLYSVLTRLQMDITEDVMNWTVKLR
ncbi:branched-chain amino acid aminotransferase 2, chloroplastic-like isoform X1 [Arachis duranensis]|uniref:Branched-chain amino acid aminotransferase 2, chloroplastic-like isoform X1 n=1 Tax=Arachis duranensis TaxID=130453 RepID=A0A6P5MKQ5_ARADU|nr:branched-chain amino acid aminotransferase 2, chloroplastic-like isoform X1 [Arachis duranensis]